MKRGLLMTTIVTGILTLAFGAMTVERSMAAGETSAALDLINQGLDWDETTPITMEQQTDRMNANLEVLQSQKSQRNTQGTFAFLMLLATGGTAFAMQKQGTETE